MRTNTNSLTSIGLNIGYIARRWRARVDERLVGLGLTMSKWLPLRWLAVSGGSLPQRRLVELTGVEGPSLVRVLDDLERQGFIERRDCEADRRAIEGDFAMGSLFKTGDDVQQGGFAAA